MVQSILVDRIGCGCCLSVHAAHWPNERSRTTSLRWIKLSHRRSVGHRSDRDFSSDASFKACDRLAILLPNEPDYIELVYACARLGVIVLPLNTRLSVKEIDGILDDAKPRGLIRHSSLPVPTVQVSWQLVLDQEPLDPQSDSIPDRI